MAWIRRDKAQFELEHGCIFCKRGAGEEELVVARSSHVYVMLNASPYNFAHLLVVPYAHCPGPEELDSDSLLDLMQTGNRAMTCLRGLYQPAAFNMGANIGAEAGASIPAHFHLHIVPRWPGETGFITTIGDTRVIPDTLENTGRELREVWHGQ
ncbi:MAG: HIT domain-containing protein [Anaerolineaceae bacterium]|nr:HIT domain-containing protein [Anaerolineaceae bacterium]